MSETQNHYKTLAVCCFLLLAVGLVFGRTVCYDFVNFDDDHYVYDNPHVTRGLDARGVVWAFTSGEASNWHPLAWLSHMLDCEIYGLNPGGHHLTNVLLHAASAILLFLVLLRMTGDLWPSAFVAAVFAVHPLRVESVAWIAERKDVLSGFLFMLTLAAFVGYVRRPFSLVRYLAVIAVFTLGLMAKPMLVTLPFVLLLLDYWPLGRMNPNVLRTLRVRNRHTECAGYIVRLFKLVLEKVPLLALSAASCAATLWAQAGSMAVYEYVSLPLRIGNAAVSYVAYIGQFIYPVGLAALYLHPLSALSVWKSVGTFLILGAICIGVVVLRRRYPYLLTGWFWYVGMLLPVVGLVQVGSQAMADRYTYLPQIGLCIALAWGVAQACRTWPYCRRACAIFAVLAVFAMMIISWRQTSYWRDSETLWTRVLACAPDNFIAHDSLGLIMFKTGRNAEAIEQYKQALQIKPGYIPAQYNLGVALFQAGRLQEAIEHYEEALRLKPDYIEAHNNIGNALVKTGQFDEAIDHYQQVLRLDPDFADAHYNLGNVLFKINRVEEAIGHYERALTLNPDNPDAHGNLGSALIQTGRVDEAIEHYRQALRLKPNNPELHNNLGLALVQTGRPVEAIEHYVEAMRLRPDYINANYNLALAYADINHRSEAVAAAKKAARLARSQGQSALAGKIEDWLNAYRISTGQ
jgi:protein O-mannosyl-transferase